MANKTISDLQIGAVSGDLRFAVDGLTSTVNFSVDELFNYFLARFTALQANDVGVYVDSTVLLDPYFYLPTWEDTEYLRADYPDLVEKMEADGVFTRDPATNGNGTTTFKVPNISNRARITIGSIWTDANTKIVDGIKSHTHTASFTGDPHTHTDAGHTHGLQFSSTTGGGGTILSGAGAGAVIQSISAKANIQNTIAGGTVSVASAGFNYNTILSYTQYTYIKARPSIAIIIQQP